MEKASSMLTSFSPRNTRPRASIADSGRLLRLAMVRLMVFLPSRRDSRRRMAGGELRLGTRSIYMGADGITLHPSMQAQMYRYLHATWAPCHKRNSPLSDDILKLNIGF